MNYSKLQDMARLVTNPNGPLVLDGQTLANDPLAAFLVDLLDLPPLRIENVAVKTDESDGNQLILTGTTAIGPLSGLSVKLTFFVSWLTDAPTDHYLEALIEVTNPPAEIRLDQFGIGESSIVDPTRPTLPTARQSFFKAVKLAEPKLLISSYNFKGMQASIVGGIAPAQTSLGAEAHMDVVDGINLSSTAMSVEGDFWSAFLDTGAHGGPWDSLKNLAGGGDFAVSGALRLGDLDERVVELTRDFEPKERLSVSLFSGLTASIARLTVRTSLTPGGTTGLGLSLTADVAGADPDKGARFIFDFFTDALEVRMTGLFGTPLGLDWLASLAGVDRIADSLPAPFRAATNLVVVRVVADLPMAGQASPSVLVELSSTDRWKIIPDMVEVSPIIQVTAGGGLDTDVLLAGVWNLGDATFDTHLDIGTSQILVVMAPGSVVDVGDLARLKMPDLRYPLEVVDLEISGNYETGALEFVIECVTDLSLDVFGANITLTELQITGDRDQDGTSEWRIEGLFVVAGASADVAVSVGEEIQFDVTLSTLHIGDILDDLLLGISLPSTLRDFTLDDIAVSYVERQSFSLQGDSKTPIQLFDGFDFTISGFKLARTASAAPTGSLDLDLLFGSGDEAVEVRLTANHDPAGWVFTGALEQGAIPLGHLVDRILSMTGLAFPLPCEGLEISRVACRLAIGGATEALGFSCDIVDDGKTYGRLSFAAFRKAVDETDEAAKPDPWTYVLVSEVELDLSFNDLPIAGPRLPSPSMSISGVDLIVASHALTEAETETLKTSLPEGALSVPAGQIADGATLSLKVSDGGGGIAMTVPLQGVTGNAPRPVLVPGAAYAAPQPPANDHTRWFVLGKSVGPIAMDRIGLRYQDGRLGILFDARMMLGPVTIGFNGLGLSSPIDHFEPEGVLQGLSVAYSAGPISLGGGFIRTSTGYAGQLQLTTEALGFALIGEYFTNPEGLFCFGLTREPPLGGPPAFFVEGIAAGVGYNSRLVLPASAAEVGNFSLVKAAMPTAAPPFDTGNDLSAVLQTIDQDCVGENGEGWIAAGVKFSSFELVDSFALVTLEFGHSNTIAVLGLSRASLPPDVPEPVALFEVGLMAQFDPAKGALRVDGALTPRSYALSRMATLSGGFGFYAWFKAGDGVEAGDFVYSMGGYHPSFVVPDHYPNPARLSLVWQVSGDLSVKGSSYFALTPHCLMAGTSMQALWNSGCISAWFDADANFLVYWKPFHYLADIETSIGVSFTLNLLFTTVTINVHVGLGLSVKGPPFGGSAHIDLDVISFTVSFGDDSDETSFLNWEGFRTSFLPDDALVCTVQPIKGLLRDRSSELKRVAVGETEPRWIVTPDSTVLAISLTAPVKTVSFGAIADDVILETTWTTDLAIAPMGAANADFGSALTLRVLRQGESETSTTPVWADYKLARTPKMRGVPASLWGQAANLRPGDPNAPRLMSNALCGFELAPINTVPDKTARVKLSALRYSDAEPLLPLTWSETVAITGYGAGPERGPVLNFQRPGGSSGQCRDYVLQAIADAADARAAIIAAMVAEGMLGPDFARTDAVDVATFASRTVLDDWPLVRVLGEN